MVWYSFKNTSQIKTKLQIYIKRTFSVSAVLYSISNVVSPISKSKSLHLGSEHRVRKKAVVEYFDMCLKELMLKKKNKIKLKHFIPGLAADVSLYSHRNSHIFRAEYRSPHMTKK